MADSYAKIWASILDSSIWSTSKSTRLVWITLLVMKDEHGFVGASVDGIARRANVSVEEAEAALAELEAPDERSRSDVEDGRRIRRVERGWHIINHEFFQKLRDKEARKAYERERKREQRARAKAKESGTRPGPGGTKSQMSASEAEAESAPEAAGSIDRSITVPVSVQKGEGSSTPVPPAEPVDTGPPPKDVAGNRLALDEILARARGGASKHGVRDTKHGGLTP